MKKSKKAARRDIYKNILWDDEYYIESKDSYEYKYTDADGIKRTRTATTLDDLREIEEEIAKGTSSAPVTKDSTVIQMIEVYLQSKKKIDDVTLSGYYYVFEQYIQKSVLGHMKVKDVYKINILHFYNYLIEEKKFMKSTVELIHHVLNPAFRLALDCRAIKSNPCSKCLTQVKEVESEEKIVLTVSEQAKFLSFVKRKYRGYLAMIKIHVSTGVRPSELLGITESDVVFKHDWLDVNHQLQYRKIMGRSAEHRMKITKTESGVRTIDFGHAVRACFKDQIEYARFIHQTAGIFKIDGFEKFLFITSTGKPMTLGCYQRLLATIVNNYNLEEAANAAKEKREIVCLPHISPYCLRRTGLTRMSESGISAKTLQVIAGHAKIETTYNYYVQVTDDFYKEDMKKFFAYKKKFEAEFRISF